MMPEQPKPDPAELVPTVDSAPPADPNTSPPEATHSLGHNESASDWVPSFREPVAPTPPKRQTGTALPRLGDRIDDFEIIQVLGSGAFATVFLARQVSLGRQVALKVSANRGTEGRTLASLEHDHIVRVFSETVEPARNLRLMCMQYVAGTTLERVIRLLSGRDPRSWSGQAILEAIETLCTTPVAFDPAALRDRELLANSDYVETVCWIGARLAEALAHAHGNGVLHRDIKPANILLNRYGRPMLADFNVALDPDRSRGPAGEIFGGTLGYMAPEHLDAFNPEVQTTAAAVDHRSDIYSLGLVLYEMLTGKLPFGAVPRTTKVGESLRIMAHERRHDVPSPREKGNVPDVLDRVVRRCLDPTPDARYQTAAALARALDGCRQHHRVEKNLPAGGVVARLTLAHPVLLGTFLVFLPHLLGSTVNISYNALRIVGQLDPEQQAMFGKVAFVYNLIVYPLCIWIVYWVMRPIALAWRQLNGPALPAEAVVDAARRRTLQLPLWTVALSCIGWLPGGVLFPLGISLFAGSLQPDIWWHFLLSFTLSGLIALTYSVFAAQFLVLLVLYPRLWVDPQELRYRATEELRPLRGGLWPFQLLAGLIPLVGAVMMVGVGPEHFTRGFRVLVTALILLGMAGFCVALAASNYLRQILGAFMADGRPRSSSTWRGQPTMLREVKPTHPTPETEMSTSADN